MAYVSQEMKTQLAPAIKSVLARYGVKASISVRHHSSLVVTIRSGNIDFGGDYIQVNEYWINEHYTGVGRDFLTELLAAMKGPDYFNDDNVQIDYFHRSHYTDICIGKWDQPYVFTGETVAEAA
jgi:hypothetical protein